MDTDIFEYKDAKFQYLLVPEVDLRFQKSYVLGDGLIINHTASTDLLSHEQSERAIAIIGLCVDSHGQLDRQDIPRFLLSSSAGAEELQDTLCRFAGKYVIFYRELADVFVFGDATTSLPINYFTGESVCISSSSRLVADYTKSGVSHRAKRIRAGTDLSQGLPNTITMYDNVVCILPNCYLSLSERKSIRGSINPVNEHLSEALDLHSILLRSNFLIKNIVDGYSKEYDLICPLTSGWDSRVVFSFLHRKFGGVNCYTFKHSHLSDSSAEVVLPERICEAMRSEHRLIRPQRAPESYSTAVKEVVGEYFNPSAIDLAYTYKKNYGNAALINGEIIGQIGKSSIFNASPRYLAVSSYFFTKTHNYSYAAWKENLKHVNELKAHAPGPLIFDLFALENRCGRWAAQSSELYSACGVNMLNVFNCRELINLWLKVSSKERVKSRIHVGLLEINSPELLKYPCNPEAKKKWARKGPLTYFAASHVKYLIESRRYVLRR